MEATLGDCGIQFRFGHGFPQHSAADQRGVGRLNEVLVKQPRLVAHAAGEQECRGGRPPRQFAGRG